MQKHEEIYRSRKQIIINNFLGGIAWGLGATIGVGLLITVLGILAHLINVVPFVGSFISSIIDFVLQTNKHFKS